MAAPKRTPEQLAQKNYDDIRSVITQANANDKTLLQITNALTEQDKAHTKQIDEIKKLMDAMEKRHVKLIQTSIQNYDKKIQATIKSALKKR